jgi:hypothetical protein
MKLQVYPSLSLSALSKGVDESKTIQEPFSQLCKGYIQYCLNWRQDLKDEIYAKLDPVLDFIDTACGGAYYPPISGVFCLVKEN